MPIRNQLWEQSAALLAVGVLLAGCAAILAPFAPALLWAAIVSFTSWGIYRKLSAVLGGRETLAASLLVAGMLIVIVLPLIYALVAFGAELSSLYELLQRQLNDGLPALPDWLVEMPGIGAPLQGWWSGLAAGDPIVEDQVKAGLVWLSKILLQIGRFAGEFVHGGRPNAVSLTQRPRSAPSIRWTRSRNSPASPGSSACRCIWTARVSPTPSWPSARRRPR